MLWPCPTVRVETLHSVPCCVVLRLCTYAVIFPGIWPNLEPLQRCQNNDWPIHKNECAALQRWASSAPSSEVSVPSDAVRCLGRILWVSKQEGLDSVWVSPDRFARLCTLGLNRAQAKEINAMQSRTARSFPRVATFSQSFR